MDDERRHLGRDGETIAAWYLTQHGMAVLGRNVTVAGGEVDLIASDGKDRVVVEVRSSRQAGDPIDRVDAVKRNRVQGLAWALGANRVDLVGIRFDDSGFDVHWVPGVS